MSLDAQEVRDTVIITDAYDYVGQWPDGEGAYYSYANGMILGNFSKAVPDGKCVVYLPGGERYVGTYQKGHRTGYGELYDEGAGIIYVGDFSDGQMHGVDTVYRSDGSVLVGEFRKGKLRKTLIEYRKPPFNVAVRRPSFPEMMLSEQQERFLYDLRMYWETGGDMEGGTLVKPKFLGGDLDDFAYWVNSQAGIVTTPSGATLTGTVIVQFTVSKEGVVTDVHAMHGEEHLLNVAAEDIVKKSPKWEPGEYNGEKRGIRMTISVDFR
jgi:hypothetical protein